MTYFCRSRGHGFIKDDDDGCDHFVHVSDIESDFVPMKGDKVREKWLYKIDMQMHLMKVSYRLCPIPPKFEKCQAVNVQIVKMSPVHHKR